VVTEFERVRKKKKKVKRGKGKTFFKKFRQDILRGRKKEVH